VARIHSIGYEDRTPEELVDLLRSHGVTEVVDVRLNPISRRKGFSKRGLAATLDAAGIGYRNERDLGNPTDNRAAFRRGDPSARARVQASVDAAADVVDGLVALASQRTIALLCVCREHDACHRSVVADAMVTADPRLEVVPIP
jgi:uncharacterized protein (DUF488 family)